MAMFGKKNKKFRNSEIAPDEIFMDSQNLPGFDRQRFEGRLEAPLQKRASYAVFGVFALVLAIFLSQSVRLQFIQGEELKKRAEDNHLRVEVIKPQRGIIYDRNGKELAWNDVSVRILLKAEEFSADEASLARVRELFRALGKTFNQDEFLTNVKEAKQNNSALIILQENDWNKAENIRVSFLDLPIRVETVFERRYSGLKGVSHLIGYLGYPSEKDIKAKDDSYFHFWETKIGKAGIEKVYEDMLKGEEGMRLVEVDSNSKIISQNIQEKPHEGENIILTIDGEMSSELYKIIGSVVEDRGFVGGAGIIVDLENGGILSAVSFPEPDSNLLTRGGDNNKLQALLTDQRKPFFYRALEGLYPPGSIFKPVLALAALEEKIIDPFKQIFSAGSISIPNPYYPELKTIFYDWKAHGWVDMRHALAVSSNVYFYTIGGGYKAQQGLGVARIGEYAKKFKLGQETGVELNEAKGLVPTVEWKQENVNDDPTWRIGDTYNLSIGQGFLKVTPIQMARYVSAIAKEGILPQLHFVKSINQKGSTIYQDSAKSAENEVLDISKESFKVVKEGMRLVVKEGTASGLSGLAIPVAAKTGTAEIGTGEKVNSWFMGFFPYENPKLAMVVVLEKGDRENLVGGVYVASQIITWIANNKAELLKN